VKSLFDCLKTNLQTLECRVVSSSLRSVSTSCNKLNVCVLCVVQREEGLAPASLLLLQGPPSCLPPAPPPAAPPAAPLSDSPVRERPGLHRGQQLRPVLLPHAALHQRPAAHLTETCSRRRYGGWEQEDDQEEEQEEEQEPLDFISTVGSGADEVVVFKRKVLQGSLNRFYSFHKQNIN